MSIWISFFGNDLMIPWYLFSWQPDIELMLLDHVDLPHGQYDLTSCPKAVQRPMARGKPNKYIQ